MNFMPRNIAVVGAGLWGQNLVRVFAQLRVLDSIVDRDARAIDHALQMLREKGLDAGVQNRTWQEVLQDHRIAAVVLAVPVAHHKEMVLAALEHGKHVWIEKPMVTKLVDADEIVEKAASHERQVMVNHLMCYHAGVEKIIDMVQSQCLGRIFHMESERKAPGRIFQDADALEDLMPHDMAVMRSIANFAAQQGCGAFIKANGFGGVCFPAQTQEQKKLPLDWAVAHLYCRGGASVKLDVSRLFPEKQQRIILQGEKGMLIFDDRKTWTEKLIYYPHQIEVQEHRVCNVAAASGENISLEEAEPLVEAARHFIEVVQGSIRAKTSAEVARDDLEWLVQIQKQIWKHNHAE